MMFLKDVLRAGTYHLPDGRKVKYSEEDVRHLRRRLKDMRAAGLEVPCCWGHQDTGPMTLDDVRAHRAKHNLGFATTAYERPGGLLQLKLDVPSKDDYRRLPSVRYVSPEIREDYVDGTGRLWPGLSITHVAVTARPVQTGQEPFQPVQMDCVRLSLDDLVEEGDDDSTDQVSDEGDGEEMPANKLERLRKCLESNRVEDTANMPSPWENVEKFIRWLTTALANQANGTRYDDAGEDMDISTADPEQLSMMSAAELRHATRRGTQGRQAEAGHRAFEETLRRGKAPRY